MPEIIIDELTTKLLDEMGFVEDEKKRGLYETVIEDGTAFIDFRHEDGRRYGVLGKKNITSKDADKIQILKTFKERRDEIKNKLLIDLGASQSSLKNDDKQPESQDNKQDSQKTNVEGETILQKEEHIPPTTPNGVKSPPPPLSDKEQPPKPPGASQLQAMEIFAFLKKLAGNSIVEVSGRSGTGKTKLMLAFADMALQTDKKVVFIDTEQNLDEFEIKRLGSGYKFLTTLKEVLNYLQADAPNGVPNGTDIIFLDSIGAEQNGMWGVWDDTKRNRGLSEISSTAYLLKMWAIKNKKLVFISNQPKSERGKTEKDKKEEIKDGNLRPMETVGDKHSHIIKTALYLENIWLNKEPPTGGKKTTRSWVKALKCRNIGRGKELFLIDISDDGTKLSAFDKDRLMQYILPSEE